MRYQGLCEGTYAGKSLTPAGDRCKNLYPETLTGAGSPEAQKVLMSTPGTSPFYTLINNATNASVGNIQCIWAEPSTGRLIIIASQLLFVKDQFVYGEGSPGVSLRSIGTVGVGPYTLSSSGTQVMISCAGDFSGYILGLAINNLDRITAAGFRGSASNVFIDGYFVSAVNDRTIQISNTTDGRLWDALDYTVIEGGSDNIKSLLADHGELWVFCERHIEIFQDTGNAAFPFERIKSIYIPHGLHASAAAIPLDNAVFWLGRDQYGECRVYRADGYIAKGVSNRSVEYFFNMYAQKAQALTANMYGYQNESGHTFLVISFPDATLDISPTGSVTMGVIHGAQWVYDITENEWHERTNIWSDGKEGLPTARFHAFSLDLHFVGGGNPSSSDICVMREDLYTDSFTPIKRVRVAPHIVNGLKWVTYHYLRLSAQVGVVPTGFTDSVINMRVSNDGGMTWTGYYPKSLGFTGEYKKEICWRRLGRAKRRVFEFSTTVTAPVCIIDADIEAEGEQ